LETYFSFGEKRSFRFEGAPGTEISERGLAKRLRPQRGDLLDKPRFMCRKIDIALNRYRGREHAAPPRIGQWVRRKSIEVV
jgi:hypothetical protein